MVFAFFCAPAGYTTVPIVKIICITITQVALKRKKQERISFQNKDIIKASLQLNG